MSGKTTTEKSEDAATGADEVDGVGTETPPSQPQPPADPSQVMALAQIHGLAHLARFANRASEATGLAPSYRREAFRSFLDHFLAVHRMREAQGWQPPEDHQGQVV